MDPVPLRLVATNDAATSGQTAARPRLGDVLRARGLADPQAIEAALDLHARADIRLGEALHAAGALPAAGLVRALEEQWGARYVDLAEAPPDARLVSLMGPVSCLSSATVPWRRIGAATVVVTEDPAGFDQIRAHFEQRLGPVMMALAGPGEVGAAVAISHRDVLVHRAEARVPGRLSCRAWQAAPFRTGCAIVCCASLLVAIAAFPWFLTGLLALAVISLVALTALKLATLAIQFRPVRETAEIHELHGAGRPDRMPVISILVPLFREARIAAELIRRLETLDYPAALLDVCLVVEEDDDITRRTLSAVELPPWMRVVLVPEGTVKTKPRAMNYALDFCRGSVIGIYDAEDAPEPGQLREVARRFATAGPRVACLQGALDFYNPRHNWMARCFTMEYASWFRVMLPGVARLGLAVPLGGTTLFFRRKILEELGAWDAHNVTEDADLGIRLARAGYRTEILDITTWEEANALAWPWVKQRSRWLKGYAMTYAVHMRQPGRLMRDLGPWRFWGVQAMFLGTLLQFALAPLLWSMWIMPFGLWHPLQAALPSPVLTGVGVFFCLSEAVMAAMTARALQQTGRLAMAGWILTLPVYFLLGSLAVYKALYEMLHKPFYWDKTQHGKFGGSKSGAAVLRVVRRNRTNRAA